MLPLALIEPTSPHKNPWQSIRNWLDSIRRRKASRLPPDITFIKLHDEDPPVIDHLLGLGLALLVVGMALLWPSRRRAFARLGSRCVERLDQHVKKGSLDAARLLFKRMVTLDLQAASIIIFQKSCKILF